MRPTGFSRDRACRFAVALWTALALAPLDARAQDEGIQADRPDFTNGPNPLPPGVAQLEAGWVRERATSGPTNTFGLGVLRWGITNRVELQADVPSWIRQDTGPSFDSGFGDAGVGAKFLLAEGKGAALGLIANLDLPTGAEGFGSSGAGYNGTLAAERDFGPIDASANLLLGNDDETGEREWSTGASLSLGFASVWKLEAFSEWYVIAAESAEPQDFLDAGGTIPVGRHFLVDGSFGTRIGKGAQPWFSGAGGTWRW